MANDYARVMRSIWADDDFRDLAYPSQWLYFHLLTSPALNYAGVTDWRPARIAALTRDLTPDGIEAASVELEGNAYTVVDRDSEEVLIRSFIRHDGLMGSPNMAAAMAKAHAAIASKALRGVIVHELKRLHDDEPDLRGWGRPEVKLILRRVALDPREAFAQLPRHTFGNPSPKGSVNPSSQGSPTPTPTPSPTPTPQDPGQVTYLSTEGSAASPKRPPSKCRKHLNDDDPPPCGGCASARKAADAWQPPTLSAKRTMCGDHPNHPALHCPACATELAPGPPPDWRKHA